MLELKAITKRVAGEDWIYPTDLTLESGRFNILLGTTLAGKSTLMHLMAGLEKPSSGEVWFGGKDVTGVPVQKRNVSMVYQQFINYPNMSVFENIASPLRVSRLPESEIKSRVGTMAELMNISAMLDRRPSELSGGQQQRTAMARAMVKDSDLILLDEPLANLDFKLREELRDELPKIFAQRDCVVVYATTEPTEALLLSGFTAALHNGRVADSGPTSELYRQPANLTAAGVLSEPPINLARVTKTGNRVVWSNDVGWSSKDKLPDGEYTFGLRPHNVLPYKDSRHSIAIEGKVMVAELSGSESIIHFNALGNDWVSLSHGVHPFEAGATATFYANVDQGLFFDAQGQRVDIAGRGG